MKIEVNNCSLYFDVVGSGLVANGPVMEERPVIILLHGGPGFDHTTMKPAFNPLSDVFPKNSGSMRSILSAAMGYIAIPMLYLKS